jgi:hypothetical protein
MLNTWESVQDKTLTVNNINNHVTLAFVLRTSVLEFALPRVLLDWPSCRQDMLITARVLNWVEPFL